MDRSGDNGCCRAQLVDSTFTPHLYPSWRDRSILRAWLGLANRAERNLSSRDIGAHHNARCGHIRSHEAHCAWPRTLFKQSLSTAKNHRIRPHVVFVYERRGLQRLNQIAAANDLKILSRLNLERGYGRYDVTAEHRRIVPLQ